MFTHLIESLSVKLSSSFPLFKFPSTHTPCSYSHCEKADLFKPPPHASAWGAATSQPPPPHNPSSCLQLPPPSPPPPSCGPLPWKLIGRITPSLQNIATPSLPGESKAIQKHSTETKKCPPEYTARPHNNKKYTFYLNKYNFSFPSSRRLSNKTDVCSLLCLSVLVVEDSLLHAALASCNMHPNSSLMLNTLLQFLITL